MGKKEGNWNIFENLKGDKVVWMIVLMLILWSIVCIFSSTSSLSEVLSGSKTRLDVVREMMTVVGLGFGLILICYNYFGVRTYKALSRFGFLVSLVLLLMVVSHFRISEGFRAGTINNAWRVIKVGGFQVHVYEIVKVAMIMYMAWAVDAFIEDSFPLVNELSKLKHMKWLSRPFWKKTVCIYIPMFIVMGLTALGSGSSAAFIGAIMLATILVGGLRAWEVFIPVILLVLMITGFIVLNKVTGGAAIEKIPRAQTWMSRIEGPKKTLDLLDEMKPGTDEYRKAVDKIRQPYSAKIAIKQGGLLGKGAGQSTQRYVVPVMYEDYMFSFIIEEYGLLGAIIIIFLYVSLLARGTVIVKGCVGRFEKIAVAGLVTLITGQALLHMFVNVGIGPLTGQTLPLISYGSSSFIMFCIAFGVILSLSRGARQNIEKERQESGAIHLEHMDPISEDMDSEV